MISSDTMKPLAFLLLLAIACTPSATVSASEGASPQRNILFIIADDLATRLRCYGDSAAITPHLDQLASEGVLFAHAYCQGAVCTPSRTSFMLGLNNLHANPSHFIKHPETMTLGRWFREHGYQTCAIGKIDHDDPQDAYTDPRAWDVRVPRQAMQPAIAVKRQAWHEDLGEKRQDISFIGTSPDPLSNPDHLRTNRLLHFFEKERDTSKPFFAAIGYHAPHVPWYSVQPHFDAHAASQFQLETIPPDATPLPAGSLLREPRLEISPAQQLVGMRAYYAAVTTLDAEIGRLLHHLRLRGDLDNTLIVFTSDHGYHLGWRGQWCKHSLSEQVLRVPLIVRHPQANSAFKVAGAKAAGIVELLDLFPTFCEFAGLSLPTTLDGQSFLHQLENPAAAGKAAAYCRWGNGRTVRTQRWRLVERNDGTAELYDHHTDPSEYHNVIADPKQAAVAKRLQSMLQQQFGPAAPKARGKTREKP
jgi:iduronate 2-sulfatase